MKATGMLLLAVLAVWRPGTGPASLALPSFLASAVSVLLEFSARFVVLEQRAPGGSGTRYPDPPMLCFRSYPETSWAREYLTFLWLTSTGRGANI
jgi:hypothetical protein